MGASKPHFFFYFLNNSRHLSLGKRIFKIHRKNTMLLKTIPLIHDQLDRLRAQHDFLLGASNEQKETTQNILDEIPNDFTVEDVHYDENKDFVVLDLSIDGISIIVNIIDEGVIEVIIKDDKVDADTESDLYLLETYFETIVEKKRKKFMFQAESERQVSDIFSIFVGQ